MRGRHPFVPIAAAFVLAFLARGVSAQCPGGLTFTYTGSSQATVGVAYTGLIDTHGTSTGAVNVTAVTNLPPGLRYQVDHQDVDILGTPTRNGTYAVSVAIVEPATGRCGTAAFTITVTGGAPPLAIAPALLPDGVIGVAYSQRLSVTGGTGPFTFSALGALAPGLSLSSDGLVSGTPSLAGQFSFGVTVTGTGSSTATASYSIRITATPAARLTVTMTDGGVPWGDITYAPSSAGPTLTYVVTATNLGSAPAADVDLHVLVDGALAPCALELPGTEQQTEDFPLGTLAPGQQSVTSLPQTVCLQRVLAITGTAGISTYQIVSQASLASPAASSDSTAVVVTPYCRNVLCTTFCPLRYLSGYPCAEIGMTPNGAQPLAAVAASAFLQAIQAANGTPPYRFSASGLPAGISLDADAGVLSGTVTDPGRFETTVGVEDASGCHNEQTYVVNVCPADGSPLLSPRASGSTVYPLPGAVRERPYRAAILLACGTAPYTASSPSLPPGLALSVAAGEMVLQGTPSTPGDFSFAITVTDAASRSTTATYSVHVGHCSVQIGPDALPPAMVGQPYSFSFTGSGGTPSYGLVDIQPHCGAWDCGLFRSSGFRPDVVLLKLKSDFGIGYGLGATEISGTPTQDGRPTFTVFLADESPGERCGGARTYTLEIQKNPAVCPDMTFTADELPAATVGVPYEAFVPVAGGAPPYRFDTNDLPLPSGLSIDPFPAANGAGHIVGTPVAEGSLAFTVFAQDANNCVGSRQYGIEVGPNPHCGPIYVSPWTLAPGKVGVQYVGTAVPSDRINASNGVRPYRLVLASMPAGLNLALDPSTGELTGVPQAPGTYSFEVTAVDSNAAGACAGSLRYSIEIQPGLLSGTAEGATLAKKTGRGLFDAARSVLRTIRHVVAAVRTVLRDLPLYYAVRDRILGATPGGRELTRLYYRNAPEITSLLKSDPALRDLAFAAASSWEPPLRSLVAGLGSNVTFTSTMASSMNALLARLQALGSPALKADIASQTASFPFASWVGLTLDQARARLDRRACVASDGALCLNGGRFRVEAAWLDFAGNTGPGHAVPLTGDTGYFWFFTANNVELVVKALDGRAVNDRFWLFYGALSNVEYTLTVTDTVTGAVKTYRNASGQLGSVADTDAFPGH